jgi:peptidoglycan/xylan/chitin deacetylase (PgdA/CDA1 family)
MAARNLLRESFAKVVIHCGIAKAVRSLLWRDRVAIILYHDPLPDVLDQHLAYLKSICDIVSIDQVNAPGNGRPRAVITLDDGHARNEKLLPIFIKHGVKPTIYICSAIVGHARSHWWLDPSAKGAEVERLKRLTNKERLAALGALGYQQDGQASPENVSGLSITQLESMLPYVNFESHTRFHPILTRCDDGECSDEISISKREIEELISAPCRHFAYTNGNYGKREIAALKRAGYTTGRTCDVGWNDERTDPFRLKAFDVGDDASVSWLAAHLTGIPLYLRYLRQSGNWRGHKPQF